MERLNWHIADELSKEHRVTIISHGQAKLSAPSNTHFYSVPLNPLPIFLICAFFQTFWVCLTQHPDILFAGSGLTAPIAVFWAKIFRKKSLVYIHGLDIGTNNKLYNFLWIPFIRSADQIIANSSPTYDICLKKGVNEKKLSVIHPGVNFPPKSRDEQLIQNLKNKHNLQNKKILISIGRLTQRKGLNEFIDFSFSEIVKTLPDTVLVIIGDTPNQSLNKNLQSKELLLATAKKHYIENNIIFTGNISDDDVLSSFYYLAALHIFPVKHIPDDPEGFGMVAIEAAAHGTPTIAFATGGIIDAVKQNESGWLVEKNNYQALSKQVIEALGESKNIEKCKNFSKEFEWGKFGQQIKAQL
ncbi:MULTISPECIES: glycosyltransferase family 4 protein [unclassified Acinetobacter]|uniref:glycosyltransferase family 4 protein n=1 Tax=unclassified Acinetobacter TaxID=196816 RepID=UPI001909C126|nr:MULTISPECIES: glycosyltransferase family 4 protein [unclassified Acinetobacter]MBK0062859.1 glycosyltransferase family 4 protein [Acinetobacter sp. S55]MBK0065564.1 glycosyltransferase family 4 protein [Acinetobacter sp. S54]